MNKYRLVVFSFLFSANIFASILKDVDLAGSDAGLAYTEHDTIMLTSPIRYLGWGIVEEFERKYLEELTTKGAVGAGNDLRMDLLYGAKGQISLGYLTSNYTSNVKVYDEHDNLLKTKVFQQGETYQAANPEYPHVPDVEPFLPANDGQLDIEFDGTAAYLVFDFDDQNTSIDPFESFQIDNLHYETAEDEILDRFIGSTVQHAAKSKASSQAGLVESFNLHVSAQGIGTIAPMYIESGILGDYTISVQGNGGVTGFGVTKPYFQIEDYERYDLLFSDQEWDVEVNSNSFFNLDTTVNTLQVRGLNYIAQAPSPVSVFQAFLFEGEGDFLVTLTSKSISVDEPSLISILFGTCLLSIFLFRIKNFPAE